MDPLECCVRKEGEGLLTVAPMITAAKRRYSSSFSKRSVPLAGLPSSGSSNVGIQFLRMWYRVRDTRGSQRGMMPRRRRTCSAMKSPVEVALPLAWSARMM